MTLPTVIGCDFSSSPDRRKPIVLAQGLLCISKSQLTLQALHAFASLEDWSDWLAASPATPWVGGFDLPFGLPRELVQTLGWPLDWLACMDHYAGLTRAQIREQFKAFCDARPAGGKFAHRATDIPADSSPSMKWVNPPVAYMLHAGLPRLRAAGVHLPGLMTPPDVMPERVGLEAYPALLARTVLGRRSYKSDAVAKQNAQRLVARQELLDALQVGIPELGLSLVLNAAQRQALEDDAKGDALDAVLCMLQAAWAVRQHTEGHALYGLPPQLDPLEGWIIMADADSKK